jgi:SOS response regulatory protein OraA/RecX
MGGVVNKITDDILGFDPNGGGIYNVANNILGDTIADDVLGLDPGGGGIVPLVNTAANVVVSNALGDAVGGFLSAGATTDAAFIAADASQLAAQGLGEAQIASTLASSGVSTDAALLAASMASNSVSAPLMTEQLNNLSSSSGLTLQPTGAGADSSFIAQDASQLAAQGLSEQQITQALEASGVSSSAASLASSMAANGLTQQLISEQLNNLSNNFGLFTQEYDTTLQGIESSLGGLGSQINTQGEQFQTLLQQYRDLGLDENVALQQTVNDMGTNLSTQINTQGEQFQTLLQQYRDLGMMEGEAFQRTLSDMQTNTEDMFTSLQDQLVNQQTTTAGLFDSLSSTISGQGDLLSSLAQLTMAQMLQPAISSAFQQQQAANQPQIPAYQPLNNMPVYDPAYYQQIQNYYTGYIPNMPRDVATPLQQWYSQGYTGPDEATKKAFGG